MSSLFPELDERSARPAATRGDDERERPVVRLELGPDYQAIRGSSWSREKFRQLLGLPAPAAEPVGPVITAAHLMLGDGRIELALDGAELGRVLLRLAPCRPSRTNPTNFRLLLEGPVPNDEVRQFLERAQQRLHRVPYRLLLKAIQADPGRERVTVARAAAHCCTEEEFERSVVRTHRGAAAWRIFFADLEQQRNFVHNLAGNILLLKHEDLECCYATPCLGDGTISFFNYSASVRQDEGKARPTEQAYRPPPRSAGPAETAPSGGTRRPRVETDEPVVEWGDVATDLTDVDVIKGGTRKLEKILDTLAERTTLPDLVLVKMACVAKVIGDDLSEAMKRFEARTGVPTVFLDNLADADADFFSTVLDRMRWAAEFRTPAERAGRVNLVGFPQASATDRLVAMLAKLGVTVNARLVPEVRLEDMRHYTWAELQVLVDARLYARSYEQLFGNLDMPALRVAPPFGVEGTRRVLGAILRELGRDEADLDPVWAEQWDPLTAQWASLSARARQQRLGFVVDHVSMDSLLHPAKGSGVPLLDMLREMGFELEFLVYTGDGTRPDRALPGRCRPFRDPATLAALLRDSTAAAFYSEFYFDRRLSRTGKAQFSVADFQPGLEGALATLTRLLRICDTSYYRRYASYLGPPFDGPAPPDASVQESHHVRPVP